MNRRAAARGHGIRTGLEDVHGDASTISVEAAEAIHDRIPNARLIVLEDIGHFPYIEAPQAFKAAVKAFIW